MGLFIIVHVSSDPGHSSRRYVIAALIFAIYVDDILATIDQTRCGCNCRSACVNIIA